MHASARWLFVVWLSLIGGVAMMAHAAPQTGGAAQAAAPAATVNLNTASPAELERLPGIGPRTAERIVEYRTKNGDFKKVEELMNVQGIGEKSFLRLKPLISVTPPKASPSGAWA
ncbi:MAG: helix-hairpin-helix domain-containing protein [Vicinamibacterales bacterium]|nr:helix-hairpin-helix domain-containing protein [Vicinamibacterales bacterium]